MNIQAMMKQAQKLQTEMMSEKKEIDNKEYEVTNSFVAVKLKGTKELLSVKIDIDNLEKDDIEMLEDILVVAINEAIKKIDKETEERLGKYTKGMPGLF